MGISETLLKKIAEQQSEISRIQSEKEKHRYNPMTLKDVMEMDQDNPFAKKLKKIGFVVIISLMMIALGFAFLMGWIS